MCAEFGETASWLLGVLECGFVGFVPWFRLTCIDDTFEWAGPTPARLLLGQLGVKGAA